MKASAILSAEMRLWRAARDLLLRRALPPTEPGYAVHSGHRQHVMALVVLLLIEAPSVHFIVGALLSPGLGRSLAQLVLGASSGYAIVWLLGDLRLLQETRGLVVEPERLCFDCGQRAQGEVPLDRVARIETGRFESDGGSIRVSPTLVANCRIWLRHAVELRGPWGVRLRGDRVDVHLGDPDALVRTAGKSRPQTVRFAHGLQDRPSASVE